MESWNQLKNLVQIYENATTYKTLGVLVLLLYLIQKRHNINIVYHQHIKYNDIKMKRNAKNVLYNDVNIGIQVFLIDSHNKNNF